jgi:glycosyltransferase involved in cell wall biosynthesis
LANTVRLESWLMVARLDRKTSLIRALVVTVAVTLFGLTLSSDYLNIPVNTVSTDQHALISLELAIDWVYCGKYSMHSVPHDLLRYLLENGDSLRHLPVSTFPEMAGGSRDMYCSSVTNPFLNNENSLFYIYSTLLRMRPNITLVGLGVALTWMRVGSIVFFVFALICVGASPLFALLALMIGLEISGLTATTHLYSGYPFLLSFMGIYAGLLALTLHFGLHRNNRSLAVASVAIGLFGGLFYNLRTSYLPIVFGCYLIFMLFIFLEALREQPSAPSGPARSVGVALAGFLAGAGLFYVVCVYPLTRPGATGNLTYHSVIHPVVLSLALPANELSKREGIRWLDAVGLDLARRVDPDATYMGPTYERALMTYYSRLWRRYPSEMLGIYMAKWRLSTTGSLIFVDAKMSSLARRLAGPTRYVGSGIGFTALFLLLTIGAIYLGQKYSLGAGMLAATVAGTGFWITIESAIIMPEFYLQYHNAQLFGLFLTNLLFFQMIVNAAFRRFAGSSQDINGAPTVHDEVARISIGGAEPVARVERPRRSQMRQKSLVSIVTPFYNEASTLTELLRRIVSTTDGLKDLYDFEFVFVDDGSRDESLELACDLATSEPRLRVVQLRRNYGQTAALQAGLDTASGDIIITMDADLQHFPEEMPAFLEKIDQGYDVVCGWRHQRQEGLVRRWPSRAANYLLRKVSGLSIHDIGTTYRAYRREIIADVRLLGESHRYVPVYAKVVGARIEEIPIRNIERTFGISHYGISRTINVLMDIVFIFFYVRYLDRPIRIFGKMALVTFTIGLAIAGILFVEWLRTGAPVVREHSGWFTLSVTSLLASLQFLLAGIIGDMVARVYFSSNQTTTYKIRKTWSKDEVQYN